MFGLVERGVRVEIVGEHVWIIMHRDNVRISPTIEQFQGNLSMSSLTSQVEGSYIPTSVAVGAVSTVGTAAAAPTPARLVQLGFA